MKIQHANDQRENVIALLKEEQLLVDDLPANLDNFFVAIDQETVIGVAGLEPYGDCGLLRSVAVRADSRNRGVAKELVKAIEALAKDKGLRALYLLTETAPDYFQQKKYIRIGRADVPVALQTSSEFSYACPQSAVVMQKTLI